MNRNWLLLGGLALVLVLGVYLVDHGRAPSSLGAAYTVRDAGAFWRLIGHPRGVRPAPWQPGPPSASLARPGAFWQAMLHCSARAGRWGTRLGPSAVVFRELKPGDGDNISQHGEGHGE